MLTLFHLDNVLEMKRWDTFVDAHPDGTPFHLSGWLKSIHETYSLEPWLFVLEGKEQSINALAPFFRMKHPFQGNRLVSLPFSDYCAPLGLDEAFVLELLQRIIDKAVLFAKKIEIRGPIPDMPDFNTRLYYKRHTLQLSPDPENVMNRIDKRTIRYNIRKAQREGLDIVEANNPKGIEAFQRLHILTRKKHGIPHQPKSFFMALARNLLAQKRAFLLLAAHDSQVIAASFFMEHQKTIFYKYNVSHPTMLIKFSPNHLLTWKAIERGCRSGFERLDFGRTDPGNQGLMRYKKMWGAEVQDLPYCYSPASAHPFFRREDSPSLKFYKQLWRHVPESIASRIGPEILRRFG